jgi:hypothetical protein
MLHFSTNKLNVVCISVCDWGEARHVQEVTPSLYDFAKEQDATNAKKIHWWVALELFFVYSKSGIKNSPQRMAKQHATTLRSKTDSMGKLANVIWGDEYTTPKCVLVHIGFH